MFYYLNVWLSFGVKQNCTASKQYNNCNFLKFICVPFIFILFHAFQLWSPLHHLSQERNVTLVLSCAANPAMINRNGKSKLTYFFLLHGVHVCEYIMPNIFKQANRNKPTIWRKKTETKLTVTSCQHLFTEQFPMILVKTYISFTQMNKGRKMHHRYYNTWLGFVYRVHLSTFKFAQYFNI